MTLIRGLGTLKELPLSSCNQLLDVIGFKRSVYEKFILLSLTGGIPWYIEQMDSLRRGRWCW